MHYVHGSRLLIADSKIAAALFLTLMRGKALTRREHNLLVRVLADLFRLIPLSFFVLVPMMEFALPFAIKLFPNLLPSTFEEKHLKEEKQKRLLKMRLEIAQVLHHTLEERAQQRKRKKEAASKAGKAGGELVADGNKDLRAFLWLLKEGGHAMSHAEMLDMMALFKDKLSLDTLSRRQLESMCQFLGLRHFGPDALLRYNLSSRLRQLQNDDKDIMWEGIGSLTQDELKQAMRARGIPTKNLDKQQMQAAMQEWLQMSQNREIPNCLLMMANMFRFQDKFSVQAASSAESAAPRIEVLDLQAAEVAMSSIPKEAIDSALAEDGEERPQEALAALEREQALVEEERLLQSASAGDVDTQPLPAASAEPADAEAGHTERLSREQLHDLAEAVETMSVKSSCSRERQEVEALEQERLVKQVDAEENLTSLERAASGLTDSRVSKMIQSLRSELDATEGSMEQAFHSLDLDEDGVLSYEELRLAMDSISEKKRPRAAQFKQMLEQLDPDADGKINVSDLSRLIVEIEMRDVREESPAPKQTSHG